MIKIDVINVADGLAPSRWSRVTGAAKRAVFAIKSAVVAGTRAVAAAVKSAAAATARIAANVAKRAASGWRVVVRPTLRSWGKWTAAGAWIVSALIAPLPVMAATVAVGAGMIGMSRLVERLDASGSLAARVALGLVEAVGHAVLAAFYAVVVVDAILFPPLAIAMIVDMALRARAARDIVEIEVVEGVNAPAGERVRVVPIEDVLIMDHVQPDNAVGDPRFLAMVPAKIDVAALRERVRDSNLFVTPVPGEAIVPGVHCAKGAEEMMDELTDGRCHACGEADECLTRSQPLPYASTDGTSKPADPRDIPDWFRPGDAAARSRVMLCSECFVAECEEIALALTGVSLKATNVDVRLNERGLATTRAHAASLERSDCLHWEPTAWWRDRQQALHARAWTCFHAGSVVGRVSFAHKKRAYVAATTKVLGTVRSLELAKGLVNDELMDAGAATSRMLQALAGMGESAGALVAAPAKAG